VLLHQPHGGVEGQSADIARQRHRVEEILGEHTGQTIERIHEDTERDFILGPQEALEYGVVDEVVARRALVGVPEPVALRR
jgi:ATP-dependent Clp protease protease subunit